MCYKSNSFERFNEYRTLVEKSLETKIKALRLDRGEYLSKEFLNYLRDDGIASQGTTLG